MPQQHDVELVERGRTSGSPQEGAEAVLDAFRRWGYLEANLDPLGFLQPRPHPELAGDGEAARLGREWYCGPIGVEFMHIPDPDRRRWVQERMEQPTPPVDAEALLDRLLRAELFEEVLHGRYPGSKRFSLEGVTGLIPLLDQVLESGSQQGLREALIGMSHRGRLNVMVHIVGRPARDVYAGFEDIDPKSVLGSGDVKYHMGATGTYRTRRGDEVRVKLVSNPSHLEAVYPVALGRTRARQSREGEQALTGIMPIVLHGDAAFAGQGITAEALNFADLPGFTVGGALHVVVNNLLGFTTPDRELHGSPFATDVARRLAVPIFHVNGEDLPAIARVARLATEFRYAFSTDVVIDMIGYRRHGHSEVDDPTITQPLMYKAIKEHPALWEVYAERAGIAVGEAPARVRAEYNEAQEEAKKLDARVPLAQLPEYWSAYEGGCHDKSYEVDTGVGLEALREVAERLTSWPDDFAIHPKVRKLLEQRASMAEGRHRLDFGMAEALAFGTLLREGHPVRLSGQDSERGTFNQRHAVLIDVETERKYVPLAHVATGRTRCEIYNSTLSEAAALAFEYGFSRDYPEALVLWEAQFGDFVNNAQVIIDQFLSAGEDKWGLLSGLVLLLPHGYEGQGPEHSSARIERFLQLAGEDNLQVCQPSTAGQYFHMLRRQALRRWRKPLVVFTPKSMLRHASSSSPVEDLTRGRFQTVLEDDEVPAGARRVLLATGKILHELRAERKRRADGATAILGLEQLYPFPMTPLAAALGRHPDAREVVWVQEEPKNMGAHFYVMPRLRMLVRHPGVRSVKRRASASPATGSGKAHVLEQQALLALAFAGGQAEDEA
ncbi:MAG TPA: 2-oxoglutarate dehydrogenase E1 component [Vicinamibacterales bacterium]|nr:2-oxoglutarate dehydrogenase E1 component [Vicinamibacterales bacterium]